MLDKPHSLHIPLPRAAASAGFGVQAAPQHRPYISHCPPSLSCSSTACTGGGQHQGTPKTHPHVHTHTHTHAHAKLESHNALKPRGSVPAGASGTPRFPPAFALCSLPSTGLSLCKSASPRPKISPPVPSTWQQGKARGSCSPNPDSVPSTLCPSPLCGIEGGSPHRAVPRGAEPSWGCNGFSPGTACSGRLCIVTLV